MDQHLVDLEAIASIASLETLKDVLSPLSMMAGWNKHEPSLWPPRKSEFHPYCWSWEFARRALDVAGRLIDTTQADRRNLFLVNPLEGNYYATLRTLVSAYQMIRPGEQARSHRHAPNALRLVLDVGDNCYTVVDGVRINMLPGDVVLTPGDAFHGHGNDGSANGYWIDFLDVPLVHQLEPMSFEPWPDGFQETNETTRESPFVFPLASLLPALERVSSDAYGRIRLLLDTPSIPTMSLHMQRVRQHAEPPPLRTTANQIVAVVSGSGWTEIEGAKFEWQRGDVIAIPAWNRFVHHVASDTVLFSVSDELTMEKLGFLRIAEE